MKILKNTTTIDIELDFGITVLTNSSRNIDSEDYINLSSTSSLEQLDVLIDNEDIIVNDGTNDLSIIEGKAFIRYPDTAKNIRYDNSNTTINATNVQDAINIIQSPIYPLYGSLNMNILVPLNRAIIMVDPTLNEYEIDIEGELVI